MNADFVPKILRINYMPAVTAIRPNFFYSESLFSTEQREKKR